MGQLEYLNILIPRYNIKQIKKVLVEHFQLISFFSLENCIALFTYLLRLADVLINSLLRHSFWCIVSYCCDPQPLHSRHSSCS